MPATYLKYTHWLWWPFLNSFSLTGGSFFIFQWHFFWETLWELRSGTLAKPVNSNTFGIFKNFIIFSYRSVVYKVYTGANRTVRNLVLCTHVYTDVARCICILVWQWSSIYDSIYFNALCVNNSKNN